MAGLVTRLGNGQFLVRSYSNGDTHYCVDLDEGGCTCDYFMIHNQPCKHMLYLYYHGDLSEEERQRLKELLEEKEQISLFGV